MEEDKQREEGENMDVVFPPVSFAEQATYLLEHQDPSSTKLD